MQTTQKQRNNRNEITKNHNTTIQTKHISKTEPQTNKPKQTNKEIINQTTHHKQQTIKQPTEQLNQTYSKHQANKRSQSTPQTNIKPNKTQSNTTKQTPSTTLLNIQPKTTQPCNTKTQIK